MAPMRISRALIVVLLVLVGAAAATVLIDSGRHASDEAAPTTTTSATAGPVAGARTVAGPATTATTSAPAASGTTAARSAAATPARAAGTATTQAPTATTAVAARTGGSCGIGEATAAFEARDETNTVALSSFTPVAVVANHVNVDIVLQDVVLEVQFPTAAPLTVRFAASGTRVAAGGTATFVGDRISNAEHYTGFRFSRFAYEPNGQPSCLVASP